MREGSTARRVHVGCNRWMWWVYLSVMLVTVEGVSVDSLRYSYLTGTFNYSRTSGGASTFLDYSGPTSFTLLFLNSTRFKVVQRSPDDAAWVIRDVTFQGWSVSNSSTFIMSGIGDWSSDGMGDFVLLVKQQSPPAAIVVVCFLDQALLAKCNNAAQIKIASYSALLRVVPLKDYDNDQIPELLITSSHTYRYPCLPSYSPYAVTKCRLVNSSNKGPLRFHILFLDRNGTKKRMVSHFPTDFNAAVPPVGNGTLVIVPVAYSADVYYDWVEVLYCDGGLYRLRLSMNTTGTTWYYYKYSLLQCKALLANNAGNFIVVGGSNEIYTWNGTALGLCLTNLNGSYISTSTPSFSTTDGIVFGAFSSSSMRIPFNFTLFTISGFQLFTLPPLASPSIPPALFDNYITLAHLNTSSLYSQTFPDTNHSFASHITLYSTNPDNFTLAVIINSNQIVLLTISSSSSQLPSWLPLQTDLNTTKTDFNYTSTIEALDLV